MATSFSRLVSVGGAATLAACLTLSAGTARGQAEEPLFGVDALQYLGAFRLPAGDYGDSSMNYSEGPIEYDQSSCGVVGHFFSGGGLPSCIAA